MATPIKPTNFYEDCGYRPHLCISNDGETIEGISLLDGTIRTCNTCNCTKLTNAAALKNRLLGPSTKQKKDCLKSMFESEWGLSGEIWWKE